MKAETWTEISKTVRTVVIQSYNQAAPESASVASWEYQLTSERKSSYSYYWSLSPVLHLSLCFICLYLFLSASLFSLCLSCHLISLYHLWSAVPLATSLSFFPLHPPFSVRPYLSFWGCLVWFLRSITLCPIPLPSENHEQIHLGV